jgi:hypothetical protein
VDRLKVDTPMSQGLEHLGAKPDALLALFEQPAVPLADQLWDTADVARYFKRNVPVVWEWMTCVPSFPMAIRLPSKGRAHPLYKAGEVIAWAMSQRGRCS